MTCPLCSQKRLRVLGRHIELSERGERDLGPCAEPQDVTKAAEVPFRPRLVAFIERVNRDCHKRIPLPVSPEVEVLTHWTDKESDK